MDFQFCYFIYQLISQIKQLLYKSKFSMLEKLAETHQINLNQLIRDDGIDIEFEQVLNSSQKRDRNC